MGQGRDDTVLAPITNNGPGRPLSSFTKPKKATRRLGNVSNDHSFPGHPHQGPYLGPQIFEWGVTCRYISHEFQLCLASTQASTNALTQPRPAFAILSAFAYTLKNPARTRRSSESESTEYTHYFQRPNDSPWLSRPISFQYRSQCSLSRPFPTSYHSSIDKASSGRPLPNAARNFKMDLDDAQMYRYKQECPIPPTLPTGPKHLRFLKLLRGSGDSQIECELTISKAEDEKYEAVSWCWGREARTKTIKSWTRAETPP